MFPSLAQLKLYLWLLAALLTVSGKTNFKQPVTLICSSAFFSEWGSSSPDFELNNKWPSVFLTPQEPDSPLPWSVSCSRFQEAFNLEVFVSSSFSSLTPLCFSLFWYWAFLKKFILYLSLAMPFWFYYFVLSLAWTGAEGAFQNSNSVPEHPLRGSFSHCPAC